MTSLADEARAEAVLNVILAQYGFSQPSDVRRWLGRDRSAASHSLTDSRSVALAASDLRSPIGRFRFRVELGADRPAGLHPMVATLRHSVDGLGLGAEVEHPLEADDRDPERRWVSAMTIRVVEAAGIALSSGMMPFHQDGLGTAGSVRFIAMCLDAGPLSGGEQSYANVLAHGLALAESNWERFVAATRPDALTVTRTSGLQRLSTTGPMFYVDETGLAGAHYRSPGGEYDIQPSRAVRDWFPEFTESMTESAQVEPLVPGDCMVVDNLSLVHARSRFRDSGSATRRLSRKWYSIDPTRRWLRDERGFRLSSAIYRS